MSEGNDYSITLNFSDVKKLNTVALAELVNLIFEQQKNGKKVQIKGASRYMVKTLKALKMDRYITLPYQRA